MDTITFKKLDLYQVLRQRTGKNAQRKHLQDFVESHLNCTLTKAKQSLKNSISYFCSKLFARWDKCRRIEKIFLKENYSWLQSDITFSITVSPKSGCVKKRASNVGRPRLLFEDCTPRTKRLRTQNIRSEHSLEVLTYAAAMKFREEGKESAAKLLQMLVSNPAMADKILIEFQNSEQNQNPLSADEAVSLIVEADLSKAQYLYIRNIVNGNRKKSHILLSYSTVLEAKTRCYPPPGSVTVTETSAEVQLQALLDHTIQRLIFFLKEIIERLSPLESEHIFLNFKWGLDGSSGHAQYKQRMNSEIIDDNYMFFTATVPLQLYVLLPNSTERKILWQNPRPSSTRFCRPIRFQMKHETKDLIVAEKKYITEQIESLQPTKIILESGQTIIVTQKLKMTMIDGKVRSAITDSSVQTCCACGAKPSQTDVESISKRPVDDSVFAYGILVLHARLRCLEYMLNIAYKLEVQKWRVNEAVYQNRKNTIQKQLRKDVGLIIDVVKQGFGTTNDGNTARRFFENYELVSAITGVNRDLLFRFHIILTTLACGYTINIENFRTYALDTAKLCKQLHPWYYMPASIHFILIHGADVMLSMELPVGLYSEEALEAKNKNIRSFKENRTRKISRITTNIDLFNRLLLSSDPYLSSIRKLPHKTSCTFPSDVLSLLNS